MHTLVTLCRLAHTVTAFSHPARVFKASPNTTVLPQIPAESVQNRKAVGNKKHTLGEKGETRVVFRDMDVIRAQTAQGWMALKCVMRLMTMRLDSTTCKGKYKPSIPYRTLVNTAVEKNGLIQNWVSGLNSCTCKHGQWACCPSDYSIFLSSTSHI